MQAKMSEDPFNSYKRIPEISTKEAKYGKISRELFFAGRKLRKETILLKMSSENFATFE